jgi:hypothetical protein
VVAVAASRNHEGVDTTDEDIHVLACVECPRVSSVSARGWKAYRVERLDDERPSLAFYCPACAQRESAG